MADHEISLNLQGLSEENRAFLRRTHPNNPTITNALTNNVYTTNDINDSTYRMLIGMINSTNVIRADNISGMINKTYNGPGDLDFYIRYRVSTYPNDWDYLKRVGQFLILHNVVSTDDLLNWSRYFVNLMIDVILPPEEEGGEPTVNFMGNLPVYPNHVQEFARPPPPAGFGDDFAPATAFYHEMLSDIVTISNIKAAYQFPVIFFFVLRSRLGVPGKNYRNRLSRISNFAEIYSQGHLTFNLPDGHHFKTLMTENDGPNTAQNPQDKDILAKLIKLRTGIDTENITRISYGIIIQNCVFFGLSNYVGYERIISKIGASQANNLIGAITTTAKIDQTVKFFELLSMATLFPDDKVWYCIRAVDTSFMHEWTPRMLNWITLNLAYLMQSLLPDVDNNPYTNLLQMDKNTFKPFDANRERHLDAWINYWQATGATENDGSLTPPPIQGVGVGGPDAEDDIMNGLNG